MLCHNGDCLHYTPVRAKFLHPGTGTPWRNLRTLPDRPASRPGIAHAPDPAVTLSDDRGDRLAITCLRQGPDPGACRLVKDRAVSGLGVGLEEVAGALRVDPATRAARLAAARTEAARLLAEAGRLGADLITSNDLAPGRYPARLTEIADPPLALWRIGPTGLDRPAVAIVGARDATPAGLVVAGELSRDLAAHGYTVVSGLAAGVDGAAHEAALAAGGQTIAVLGCGIDVVYPPRHHDLARRMAASGCLVSEFPPGTGPRPWHFPLRNRIISGLALAVVVVEASEHSGSLITARMALEQGRDVLAVPGSVASGRYKGCHALIRDGARLVESVDDVLEELEGIRPRSRDRADAPEASERGGLAPVMARGEPCTVDELAARTGRPVPELLADLGRLEIEGRVRRAPGGRFVRP